MYFKRFLQLFIVFFISICVSEAFVHALKINSLPFIILWVSVIGYIVLTVPLVIMTVIKAKKKNTNDLGEGKFSEILANFDNKICLAFSDESIVYNSIVTFKQSQKEENVLYVVTPKTTRRAQKMDSGNSVAITSWFTNDTGLRFSSNRLNVECLKGYGAELEIDSHPEILNLNENAKNMMVMKLRLNSVLIESFKDTPVILEW